MTDQTELRTLATGRYLDLVARGHWEYATRSNTTGAVAIVAVTDDDELILVDQYRIPTGGRVIELPAGLVGDEAQFADEPMEQAARRELLEETGYHAAHLEHLTEGVSSAGLTDEKVNLFRATHLTKQHEGGGDASENITVHRVPRQDAAKWIASKRDAGFDIDIKVYAALYWINDIALPRE